MGRCGVRKKLKKIGNGEVWSEEGGKVRYGMVREGRVG